MKRIGLLMMWGGLFAFQTGCNKTPPPGPVTIVGKAYIYGNRDPVANAVFQIIWEGRGSTFLDTVHSDEYGQNKFPPPNFLKMISSMEFVLNI